MLQKVFALSLVLFGQLAAGQVDGGWCQWGDWSSCSVTCGEGVISRSRGCTNPVPSGGGNDCVGNATETQVCSEYPCSVDGGWCDWSDWGSCDVTCGGGSQSRTRSCSNPAPAHNGAECVGDSVDTQVCGSVPCPVDGGWCDWSDWGSCDVTCGGGSQSRSRSCSNPAPAHNGSECVGDSVDTQACGSDPCPVDGGWCDWSDWGSCDVTCGGGSQSRSRSCSNPAPAHNGSECVGDSVDTQVCGSDPCPVDGGWCDWSDWGSCDVTCGGGSQSRSRSCSNPVPAHNGSECVGDSVDTQACGSDPCPVDGGWCDWSDWGSCDVTCGGGSQSRSRSCSNPAPAHNGSECVGDSVDTQDCGSDPCPVDGGWCDWSDWGSCDVTCGGGSQSRSRSCSNPAPAHNGSECVGDSVDTQDCGSDPCPVNGGWSDWSAWDDCDVLCGDGYQNRTRVCNNPEPAHGGENCDGVDLERQTCNAGLCTSGACYKDDVNDRFFNHTAYIENDDNSHQKCITACAVAGYKYSGLEFGGECHCGDTLGKYSEVPSSQCNMPCTGAPTQTCGGRDAITVFDNNP